MSFRIFGLAVVPAAYFDRLESVEDELIDLEIRRRREKEDAADALKMALKSKEHWKKTAQALEEKIETRVNECIALKEALDRMTAAAAHEQERCLELEAEHEKALHVLKEAEDRLEAAEKELRQWREMGTTVQEWANLLTYDGSEQIRPEERKGEA